VGGRYINLRKGKKGFTGLYEGKDGGYLTDKQNSYDQNNLKISYLKGGWMQ
jgi:hypothetical protein